jgi:heterodisulfide reductase subunit A
MVADDEVRIGIFICRCGTNIGGVVNIPDAMEYAKRITNVIFVDENRWICSVDYISNIKKKIAEHKINRVVVACCTPRTHEAIFRAALKEAGLNPYLLEFVSIREQCSWVHKSKPLLATEKAKNLIEMGAAKAALLEKAEETRIPVGRDCLVIGGGITGMTAALAVAEHGFNVILIEKSPELGGVLNKLDGVAPGESHAGKIISEKKEQIAKNQNIKVYADTQVKRVDGWVGDFKVRIQRKGKEEEFGVSTIIVATGMREIEPIDKFGYGKYPNVVTQMQLEKMLQVKKISDINEIAIINCVNSRNDERGCCNIGCMTSIKNANKIKNLIKEAKVYLFFRDLNLNGNDVDYINKATEKCDAMIRYPDDREPEVQSNGNRLSVNAHDILLGEDVKVNADLVVLTTGFKGDDTAVDLGRVLKIPTNSDSFFNEAHIKLRPLDFITDGIYLCGCARSPKGVKESIGEGLGAAMRAIIPMKRGYIEAEGIIADIDNEKCIGCGTCIESCPFTAIEMVDDKAHLLKAICRGCGICAVECPEDAIEIIHFTENQLLAQVEAALSDNPGNKIIAFCCHWCALGAVDSAGLSKSEYPVNIRIIRVMCSGRVSSSLINKAFELGAAGVMVAGCEMQTCHYIKGVHKCAERIEILKNELGKRGIDSNRLRVVQLSAVDGPKFVSNVKEFIDVLKIQEG